MADETALQDALIRAHERGDTDAAKLFADEIRAMRANAPAKETAPAAPTTSQKFQASLPMRIVQGARDAVDAGAQIAPKLLEGVTSVLGYLPNPVSRFFGSEADRVDKMVKDAERQYQDSRKATGQTGWDGGRLIGNVVSPANLAIAARVPIAAGSSIPVMAGKGAISGAAGGLLTPVTDPDANFWPTKAAQTGIGAVTGGVMTPVIGKAAERIIGALSRRAANPEVLGARASLQTDDAMRKVESELGPAFIQMPEAEKTAIRQTVLDLLKAGKQVDPAALLRQRDFKALNVEPTLGQVTRDPMIYARERNLRGVEGVGEPLMNRYTDQSRALTETIGKFGGARAGEAFEAGDVAVKALHKTDKELADAVTNAYNAARADAGRDAVIPTQGIAQDYAKLVYDYGKENIPGAVRNRLREFGLTADQIKATKQFTINDAEQLLKLTNVHSTPTDPTRSAAMHLLNKAVKNAILEMDDAGGVFAPARELAAKRFSLHDAVPALEAVSKNAANPDDFVQKFVLRAPVKEVSGLTKTLDQGAFDKVRDQVGAHLQRAAFGENMAGDKPFSQERFAKALRDIGTEKLKLFYSPQEIETLQRAARVGAYINSPPANAAVNYSNTASAVGNLLNGIPGMPRVVNIAQSGLRYLDRNNFVNRSMQAQLPINPMPLAPGAQSALAPLLGGVGAGMGGLLASEMR